MFFSQIGEDADKLLELFYPTTSIGVALYDSTGQFTVTAQKALQKIIFPEKWRELSDADGNKYYEDCATGITTWTKPLCDEHDETNSNPDTICLTFQPIDSSFGFSLSGEFPTKPLSFCTWGEYCGFPGTFTGNLTWQPKKATCLEMYYAGIQVESPFVTSIVERIQYLANKVADNQSSLMISPATTLVVNQRNNHSNNVDINICHALTLTMSDNWIRDVSCGVSFKNKVYSSSIDENSYGSNSENFFVTNSSSEMNQYRPFAECSMGTQLRTNLDTVVSMNATLNVKDSVNSSNDFVVEKLSVRTSVVASPCKGFVIAAAWDIDKKSSIIASLPLSNISIAAKCSIDEITNAYYNNDDNTNSSNNTNSSDNTSNPVVSLVANITGEIGVRFSGSIPSLPLHAEVVVRSNILQSGSPNFGVSLTTG